MNLSKSYYCLKTKAFIGIDPGISKAEPGAAALIHDKGYEYFDWSNERKVSKNFREWFARFDILLIAIERQWPRPTDSKQNIGKIMKNFGFWIGLYYGIEFNNFNIIYPTPREWQKAVCIVLKHQDPKEIYLKEARKEFPMAQLKYKKNSGRAVALWLATYAKRHYKVLHHGSDIS